MTQELNALRTELDSTFFRYAQITGAIEFYMLVLETPALQLAVSKTLTVKWGTQWGTNGGRS